jgi:hypothetical protein
MALASRHAQTAVAQEPAATAPPIPPEIQEALPAAQALGSARLRFLGMAIYQARLWVGTGFAASAYAQSPFALELNYARSLSGRLIAERSLKEMQRQAGLQPHQETAWLAAMVAAFPDVQAGDRITGLHTPVQGTRFWFNGQPRPGVSDAEFSRLFFGIWLSDASSEPKMRAELLGRTS